MYRPIRRIFRRCDHGSSRPLMLGLGRGDGCIVHQRDHLGFTLLELLLVVSIVAIIAAVVVPWMNDDRTLRVRGASSVLVSDIEFAQTLTLSHPDRPVVVRFDDRATIDRYWLAYVDSPNDPIIREDTGEPYLVVLGEGRARTAHGLVFRLENLPDNTLQFNAQGGLKDFADVPHITIKPKIEVGSVRPVRVSIAPSTGRIYEKIVSGDDAPDMSD